MSLSWYRGKLSTAVFAFNSVIRHTFNYFASLRTHYSRSELRTVDTPFVIEFFVNLIVGQFALSYFQELLMLLIESALLSGIEFLATLYEYLLTDWSMLLEGLFIESPSTKVTFFPVIILVNKFSNNPKESVKIPIWVTFSCSYGGLHWATFSSLVLTDMDSIESYEKNQTD